ncbi:helix-turn-helix transcriptional regulator [Bacillus sp. FJAT-44742]|uniref:helix-turn-helix transcriptional regulator n=1 Tax=Bacillus sp. FJAT-44742 TaxID=2014005 RepID=UPI000C23E946|nr:helix-turn-helix transcriptional regulator [Bacillus sp. FJAT-44742]
MNSNRLKEARTKRGMSISELARRTKLNRITISKIENGLSNPTVTTVSVICKELSKNPSDIFFSNIVNHEEQ